MIVIRSMSLKAVARLDEELGHLWRLGKLPDADAEGCADATLSEHTILKAYTDGALLIDHAGVKATIENYEYWEAVIS